MMPERLHPGEADRVGRGEAVLFPAEAAGFEFAAEGGEVPEPDFGGVADGGEPVAGAAEGDGGE